jgi:hypothetical protein
MPPTEEKRIFRSTFEHPIFKKNNPGMKTL